MTTRNFDEPLPIEHKNHPARRAARVYASRCWWVRETSSEEGLLTYSDLEQEAFCATTRAMVTYNAAFGVPIDAYLYRAAVLSLVPVLLRSSSPVSEKRHRLKTLARIVRDQGGVDAGGHPYTLEMVFDGAHIPGVIFREIEYAEDDNNPETAMVRIEVATAYEAWRSRVRAQLVDTLKDERRTEIAVPILLDELQPSDVAAQEGLPIREVYNAAQRARRRVGNDMKLWRLWRNAPPSV